MPLFIEAGAGLDTITAIMFSLSIGFAMAAATPGIIIPKMIDYAKGGYGAKNNTPKMVIAGSTLDDLTALMGFLLFGIIGASLHNPAAGDT